MVIHTKILNKTDLQMECSNIHIYIYVCVCVCVCVCMYVCMCVCMYVVSSLSCVQCFTDPVDCSLPGSSVHGISLARILEWAAISFSKDLPNPGIKSTISCICLADSLPLSHQGILSIYLSIYLSM